MGLRYVDRARLFRWAVRVLVLSVCVAFAACDPSVFSRERDGRAGRDGGEGGADAGSASQMRANAERAAGAGDKAAAQGGGKSVGQAGKQGQAGVSGGRADQEAGEGAHSGGAGAAGAAGGAGRAAADGGVPSDASMPVEPCPHARDPLSVAVAYAEAGAISVPDWVAERSGAAAARAGAQAFEAFVSREGLAMAAWGRREGLLASPPHYDEGDSFVPLFDSDATPAGTTPDVISALEDGAGVLVFFDAAKGFGVSGTGIARVPAGELRAQVLRSALPLTAANAADAGTGWEVPFVNGALRVAEGARELIYLYGCGAKPGAADEAPGQAHEGPCRVARVPRAELSRVEQLRFWDGQGWVADLASAVVAIDHVSARLSVSYNRYLGRYLALSSKALSRVALLTAAQPEGPWQALAEVSTLPSTGGFGTSLAAIELPLLRSACDDVLYISYVRTPRAEDGGTSFVTQLARIELH